MDLSVIILSYNSKQHLSVLLPSVFASKTRYSFEVILVDNGSSDGTADWAERWAKEGERPLKLIRNRNVGFSAGNNVGIKASTGRYVLLLNPDTEVSADTFEVMLDFMESRPDVGISGCKLVKSDGSLDLACRRRFPNPWNSFKRLFLRNNTDYNYTDVPVDQAMAVDSVVGAFLLIRRSTIEQVGFLDEAFFMYGEDLDWCWRCKEAGFTVWYYPKTAVRHYKGESSRQLPFRALKWFHDAMWVFYRKHYWNSYPTVLHVLVFLGIYGRLILLTLLNLFRSNRRVSA